MSSKIIIVCFDINNNINNEQDSIYLGDNWLESPTKIFDEFLEIHLFLESEKTIKNSSEIQFTFNFKFSEENILTFEIIIINDLSFIHNVSLDADTYLVFTNLENPKTSTLLEQITKYIIESSCSNQIKKYIIGIYKDKIIPTLNKESMESYFEELDLDCDFCQIKYKNNKEEYSHICLYENKLIKRNKKDNNNSKKETKNIIKYVKMNENFSIIDIVEIVLLQIYEIKMNVIFEIDKKIFKQLNSKEEGKSNSNSGNNCIIL